MSSSLVSLRRLLEVLRPSFVAVCAVRTGKYGTLFPYGLVYGSPVSGVWVLLLEYRDLVSLGDAAGRNAWLDCGDMLCLSVA